MSTKNYEAIIIQEGTTRQLYTTSAIGEVGEMPSVRVPSLSGRVTTNLGEKSNVKSAINNVDV